MNSQNYANSMNQGSGMMNSYYAPNVYYPAHQYNQHPQQYAAQYQQQAPIQFPNYADFNEEYSIAPLRKEVCRGNSNYNYENQPPVNYADIIKEEDPREMMPPRKPSFTIPQMSGETIGLKDNISTQAARFRSIFYDFLKKAGMCNSNVESYFNEMKKNLNFNVVKVLSPSAMITSYEKLLQKSLANPRQAKKNWNEEEFHFLASIITYYCLIHDLDCGALGKESWSYLASLYPGKRPEQLKKKWQNAYKVHLSKMPWSKTEDEILIQVIKEKGTERHWREIALTLNARTASKVYRHAKQCRERWINHLDPTKNRGAWADHEDTNLLSLYLELGRKWSEIAKRLCDRTENSVKNRWNSLLKKYKTELDIEPFPKGASLEDAIAWERKIAQLILDAKSNGLCTAPQHPGERRGEEYAAYDTSNQNLSIEEEEGEDDQERDHNGDRYSHNESHSELDHENSGNSKKTDSTWENSKENGYNSARKSTRKSSIMSEEPLQNPLYGNFSLSDLNNPELMKPPGPLSRRQQSAPQSLENIIDSVGAPNEPLSQDMLVENALANRMKVQESMAQMINPNAGQLSIANKPNIPRSNTNNNNINNNNTNNNSIVKKEETMGNFMDFAGRPVGLGLEFKNSGPIFTSKHLQLQHKLFSNQSNSSEIELDSLLQRLKAQNREPSDQFDIRKLNSKFFNQRKEDSMEPENATFQDLFNKGNANNRMNPMLDKAISQGSGNSEIQRGDLKDSMNQHTSSNNSKSSMKDWGY